MMGILTRQSIRIYIYNNNNDNMTMPTIAATPMAHRRIKSPAGKRFEGGSPSRCLAISIASL